MASRTNEHHGRQQYRHLFEPPGFLGRDKVVLRNQLPVSRQSLGVDHYITLLLCHTLSAALCNDPTRTRDDLLEAETVLQDTVQRLRRVLGPAHPDTRTSEGALSHARLKLDARMHA